MNRPGDWTRKIPPPKPPKPPQPKVRPKPDGTANYPKK